MKPDMPERLRRRFLATTTERELAEIGPIVAAINAREPAIAALTDEALRAKTGEFRERLARGATLDDLLVEAFAVVREAARRTTLMRHFDVQLVGGVALYRERIVEMQTGEGKTVVATLPSYLYALEGRGVHIAEANDFLAWRDHNWVGPIYTSLGLTVGVIQQTLADAERQQAYACDVTFACANELGFDYLRDNMKFQDGVGVQRGHAFALLDEVDSILIDQGRTPSIITGKDSDAQVAYDHVDAVAMRLLEASGDFQIDRGQRAAHLTESGLDKCEQLLGDMLRPGGLYHPDNAEVFHAVNQSLVARWLYRRNVDYVVRDSKVVVVDNLTGRLQPSSRFGDGLHQALQAKERVPIELDRELLAMVRVHDYFRKYARLAGMTGTAATVSEELRSLYGLEVVVVPPNRPSRRRDEPDVVFHTKREKYDAICRDVISKQAAGRPVLVGTHSIEESEHVSTMLQQRGVEHVVLNALYHAHEADIIAQAGRSGAVTVATAMAGRGTDIVLGGNARLLAERRAVAEGAAQPMPEAGEECEEEGTVILRRQSGTFRIARAEWKRILAESTSAAAADHQRVVAAGGLYVLGTERHETRRLDNQLRGRAARQGDPGSTRFYLSLEDDAMQAFTGEEVLAVMRGLGMEEGAPVEHPILTRAIESAQADVQRRNYEGRRNALSWEGVLDEHREKIYKLRSQVVARRILTSSSEEVSTRGYLSTIAATVIRRLVGTFKDAEDRVPMNDNLRSELKRLFAFDSNELDDLSAFCSSTQALTERLQWQFETNYGEKEAIVPPDIMRQVEADVMAQIIDDAWKRHLGRMDELQNAAAFVGYTGMSPLTKYRDECSRAFEKLQQDIDDEIVKLLSWLEAVLQDPK